MTLIYIWLIPAILTCLCSYISWVLYTTNIYPRPVFIGFLALGIIVPILGYFSFLLPIVPLFGCSYYDIKNKKVADWLFPDRY